MTLNGSGYLCFQKKKKRKRKKKGVFIVAYHMGRVHNNDDLRK